MALLQSSSALTKCSKILNLNQKKMKRIKLNFVLAIVVMALAACQQKEGKTTSNAGEAITLIINADIVTMNPNMPTANALAISEGKILAVGTEAEVKAAIGHYEKVIDLGGKTLLPGFIESHDHMFLSGASVNITDVSPFVTPTLAGALEKIAHTEPDKDGWIVAFGAEPLLYKERTGPTRDQLDKLFPNVPVIVFHLSGHGGFANSEALRLAGIDEQSEAPTGGTYMKDENGRLNGFLMGKPAVLSVKAFPIPTVATAFIAAQQRAAKGVTTASEFAIMNSFVLEGLQKATSNPEFPVRVVGGLFSTAAGFDELAPRLKNYENDLFKIPFIKTWTDGSIQGGTGHMSEGYHDETFGGNGAQGDQDFFNKQVLKIYELGLWPAIHANGDAAVDVALNAVEYAQKAMGSKAQEVRPQIIHSNFTRPEQIERMAALKAYPTFFTTHVYYFGDVHYEKTLGPVRAQRLSSMGDAFRLSTIPTMHNDPPVTPVDPLLNMWIAVNRKTTSGMVLGADQAITPEQALQAYTINAAYQFGMEKVTGSLEVGKYADMVVLDKNPMKVDKDAIRKIKVVTTFRGGLITFSEIPTYDHDDPPVE
jgi:predicted amidohydrolase YtcJ